MRSGGSRPLECMVQVANDRSNVHLARTNVVNTQVHSVKSVPLDPKGPDDFDHKVIGPQLKLGKMYGPFKTPIL